MLATATMESTVAIQMLDNQYEHKRQCKLYIKRIIYIEWREGKKKRTLSRIHRHRQNLYLILQANVEEEKCRKQKTMRFIYFPILCAFCVVHFPSEWNSSSIWEAFIVFNCFLLESVSLRWMEMESTVDIHDMYSIAMRDLLPHRIIGKIRL